MLERLLRVAYLRRTTVLLAASGLLVVCILLVSRISFDTDIIRLLPRRDPAVKSFDAYLKHFGTFDHIYVLFEVPDGHRISDAEDFVNRYVEQLRKAPEIESVDAELFDDVKDWNYLSDRALLLLGPDNLHAALDRMRPAGIARALSDSRSLLAVSTPGVKAYLQQDPLGILPLLQQRLGRGRALVDFDPSQTGYVSKDGRARLVMAKPVRPPFDTAFSKQLFDRLSKVEAAARAAAAQDEQELAPEEHVPVTIQVAGGYRIAIEADRMVRREIVINSATSLLGLLILVYLVFRTFWILLYGIVPLILAALLTLGLIGLAGPLSPVASGSSAMLFGLGIDGVVMMYMRYLEERGRGLGAEDAFGAAAGTARSVMLAYGTTASTFFALLLIDFPSLHDLGLLIGTGILACYVLLVTLLPALVGFTTPRAYRPIVTDWLGRFVELRGRPILAVTLVLTVGLGIAAARLRVNTSLERLQAHTAGTELEQKVMDRFRLPRDVVLAVGRGEQLEPLLSAADRLASVAEREMPSLVVNSPDIILPPAWEQEQVGQQLQHANLKAPQVAADLEQQAEAAGFRPGAFQPFVARLRQMLDPSTRITYRGLIDHGLGTLVSRFVQHTADGYYVVVYLYPRTAADLDRLPALVRRTAPSFTLTGVPFVNRELAARFLPQFLRGVAIGSLAVFAFMYLVFHSIRRALLAFVPTATGFVWSAGLLALAGVEVDLFSMFAAMTFIGIATDYAIYVIYRHSVEGTRPMRVVLAATGGGVLVACGTTLIGFGSLINSSYGPLHSFGVTSVTTIATCLVAALLVLPALLQEQS